MGFLRDLAEKQKARRDAERQRLMSLSEKELLVEIALLLEDISRKTDVIKINQSLYSD